MLAWEARDNTLMNRGTDGHIIVHTTSQSPLRFRESNSTIFGTNQYP